MRDVWTRALRQVEETAHQFSVWYAVVHRIPFFLQLRVCFERSDPFSAFLHLKALEDVLRIVSLSDPYQFLVMVPHDLHAKELAYTATVFNLEQLPNLLFGGCNCLRLAHNEAVVLRIDIHYMLKYVSVGLKRTCCEHVPREEHLWSLLQCM
jgi:hypothetical protein